MRLSKEYGLNPTLVVCYYCHRETGEIALMGANGGKKAAHHSILSQEPCAKCISCMKKGIMFVLAVSDDNATPTGTFVVLKEDSIKSILDNESKFYKEVMKTRLGIISPEAWEAMGLPTEEEINHTVH